MRLKGKHDESVVNKRTKTKKRPDKSSSWKAVWSVRIIIAKPVADPWHLIVHMNLFICALPTRRQDSSPLSERSSFAVTPVSLSSLAGAPDGERN